MERREGFMDGFERAANASKRREAEAEARADEARRLVADREAAVSAREAKARTDERAVARKIKTCVLVAAVAILLAAAAIFKIVVDAAARDADVEAHAARIAAAERAAEEERLAASRERGEATRRVAALEAATRDAERVAADADAARERLARRVAEAEARVAEMTANERENDRHVVGTLEACVARDGIAGDGIAGEDAEMAFPGVFSAPDGPGGQARALPARGFALVLVALVVVATFRVVVGGIRRRTKAKKEDEDAKREAIADAVREWRLCAEKDGSPGFRREEDDEAKTLVEEDDVFEDAFPAAGDEPISPPMGISTKGCETASERKRGKRRLGTTRAAEIRRCVHRARNPKSMRLSRSRTRRRRGVRSRTISGHPPTNRTFFTRCTNATLSIIDHGYASPFAANISSSRARFPHPNGATPMRRRMFCPLSAWNPTAPTCTGTKSW